MLLSSARVSFNHPMRIFVFEHVVGGGELHAPWHEALAAQGAAMLAAVVTDFQRAGHDVRVTLDMRANLPLSGVKTFTLAPGEDVAAAFDRAAGLCDAAVVIAPETGGALADWTRRLEALGVRSLGSSVDSIELCADKLALHEHLGRHDVPTPRTRPLPVDLSLPVVVKPRDGAGCEQTFLVGDTEALRRFSGEGNWIAQPYCAGQSVSVSLLVQDGRGRVLQAGEQHVAVDAGGALRYDGGRVPLEAALSERAARLAEKAVASVPGLRGYVGVDLVLGDTEAADVVIEINPRVTLSFVALVNLCEPALATALLDPNAGLQWSPQAVRFDAAGRCVVEQVA